MNETIYIECGNLNREEDTERMRIAYFICAGLSAGIIGGSLIGSIKLFTKRVIRKNAESKLKNDG